MFLAHQVKRPFVFRLAAPHPGVAVIGHRFVQGDRLRPLAGGQQLFRVDVARFLGAGGAVLVVSQRVEAALRGAEGGEGAAVQGVHGGAVIAFQHELRAVAVIRQQAELLLRGIVLPVFQRAVRLIVAVIGNAVEIHGVKQADHQQDGNERGQDDPAPTALAAQPGFPDGGLAARFLTLPALFVLDGGLAREQHALNGSFVQAGENGVLVPAAAAAGILPRGVGTPAHADPHRALVAGVAGGVAPGQLLHHLQLRALEQGRGLEFQRLGQALAPHGVIVKPDFFDDDFQILGVFRFLHFQRGLEHVAGGAVDPLQAFHMPGELLSLRVKTMHAHLNAAHILVAEVVYLHGQYRIIRRRNPAMPQFHRGGKVDSHRKSCLRQKAKYRQTRGKFHYLATVHLRCCLKSAISCQDGS